jgi:hypothetical protein
MPTDDPPHEPPAASSRPPSRRWAVPIRDLGLRIEGSPLEPVLAEFARELDRAGIDKVRPKFYLSTEWGVNEGTVAVAIPFHLARPDLTELHAERVGHLEGVGRADLLRYLRHEMGHVVNYAYRLFETAEWVETFGPMDRPYLEEYRAEPFSRRFVRHLPGWYAQKHPDEDWSETFAVWMTPGLDWHAEYADWPVALAKLQYCDRTMAALADRDPVVTDDAADEDVSELFVTVDDFYGPRAGPEGDRFPPGLDAALRDVFTGDGTAAEGRVPASRLIASVELPLVASVYHWTGHFPERTRPLLRHLAARADALGLTYPPGDESRAAVGLTSLVTALAMNHVHRGAYLL